MIGDNIFNVKIYKIEIGIPEIEVRVRIFWLAILYV